ncbi:MAG: winged helix-turn-helix domain-containing protein, partial [Armatimonadota bacterium]
MWPDDEGSHDLNFAADAPDAHHPHHAPSRQTGLLLDPVSRVLAWRGKRRRLTPAQASVMLLLMQAAPDPVSAAEIWANVRGYVPARPSSALRVLVHGLRLACKQTFGHTLVATVRGRGYR